MECSLESLVGQSMEFDASPSPTRSSRALIPRKAHTQARSKKHRDTESSSPKDEAGITTDSDAWVASVYSTEQSEWSL